MARLWMGFSCYSVIGVANTVIHWQLFFVFRAAFDLSQALSNFLAFCVAATFSFFANATFTFGMSASVGRYLLFIFSLGCLSLAVGLLADCWRLPGLVTVLVFSLASLVCGFLLSKFLVFRRCES